MLPPRLLILGLCLVLARGKPTKETEEAGPCIGMDCLHGVLMHGDDDIGKEHNAEDSYIQLKEKLSTEAKKPAGPCEGMDCLHGVLMHGDEEQRGPDHLEGPAGPQIEEQPANVGPEDAEEYFHGALMHGDESAGKAHKHGEQKDDVVNMEMPQKPQDLEEYWHGVMMHNDTEPGKRHHDGAEGEQSNGDASDTQEKAKPLSGEELMHGLLMHGDAEGKSGHDHENTQEEETTGHKVKPLSGEDLMHGVLMHGDEDAGHSDEHDAGYDQHPKNVKIGPDSDSLHGILMHGDEEHGKDHSEEHKELSADGEDHGIDRVTDPESMVHPEGYENVDHKDIDLNRINAQDKDDFKEWLKEERKSGEEEMEDLKSDWQQTLGYITDEILSDIDHMKRRYLARFYPPQEEPSPEEKLEAQWLGNDDMTHELTLIGNTGPIGEAPHDHEHNEK